MNSLTETLRLPQAEKVHAKKINKQQQEMWNRANVGHHLHQYRHQLGVNPNAHSTPKSGESKLNWVLLGHTRLKGHLQKVETKDSNICNCGEGTGYIEHVLLHCQLYTMFIIIKETF